MRGRDKFVSGLDAAEPDPTSLYTDSKSARDVSYNPEHHDRMKHVQRRHFFVRDMVESMELEVPFVRTDDNIADFLTKPMHAKKFYEMRAKIMNEPAHTPTRVPTSSRGGASASIPTARGKQAI